MGRKHPPRGFALPDRASLLPRTRPSGQSWGPTQRGPSHSSSPRRQPTHRALACLRHVARTLSRGPMKRCRCRQSHRGQVFLKGGDFSVGLTYLLAMWTAASLASILAITTSAGWSPAWMDRAIAAWPRRSRSPWTLHWVRSLAGVVISVQKIEALASILICLAPCH